MNIPYLSTDDLLGLNITTSEVIASIEAVIRDRSEGRVWSAPKAVITTPADKRYMMAALAAMDNPSLLAVKTVVMNPDNSEHGLPQINGLVTKLDSVTGLPVAILDGNWITAVRTAGLSATAAKYMANEDSSVIGFVGCGVQAQSHLAAIESVLEFGQITSNMLRRHMTIRSGQRVFDIAQRRVDPLEGRVLHRLSPAATDHDSVAAPLMDDGCKAG